MDALLAYLPDGSDLYWAILCVALAVLNVWQFAKARGLTAKLDHIFEHGVAPEGKVIVPAAPPPAAPPPGWTDPVAPQFILPPAQPAKRPWEK